MRRFILLSCAVFALLAASAMLLPPFGLFGADPMGWVALHLLAEMFAVLIALLAVAVSWQAARPGRQGLAEDRDAAVLLCGFVAVACCDLMHALTYAGMPPLFGPAGTHRAIFYWLAGRSVEVATIGVLLLRPARLPPRGLALALGLALGGALVWFGSARLDDFPLTFAAGTGVTPFKAGYEYALCALNMGAAALLWRRAGQAAARGAERDAAREVMRDWLYAGACFMLGLGSLVLSDYRSPSDFNNIFGHLFKLAAYVLIYYGAFAAGLRAPFEQARESAARLGSIGDNLPGGVVYQLITAPGRAPRFTYVSGAVQAVNGVAVGDVLADATVLYGQVIPEDLERMRAAEAQAARDLAKFEIEVRLRLPDGRLRWMYLASAPRAQEDGSIVWDGLQLDITERKRMEEELRELNSGLEARVAARTAELSAAIEDLEAFAGSVSHDLQAPARRIGSYAGLLAEALTAQDSARDRLRTAYAPGASLAGAPSHATSHATSPGTVTQDTTSQAATSQGASSQGATSQAATSQGASSQGATSQAATSQAALSQGPPPGAGSRGPATGTEQEVAQYLQTITRQAAMMQSLIGDLLGLARLRGMPLRREDCDLGTLLEEVRAQVLLEAPGRRIDWRIGALPRAHVDTGLMRQVWANLLGNAVKYTRGRDPALIEVSATPGQACDIIICVRDNGAGFDMNYADKLFGVFQRLHAQDEFEGTGIGLANVKRIIARHGGRVWANGETGVGARFYFTLPLGAPPAPDRPDAPGDA